MAKMKFILIMLLLCAPGLTLASEKIYTIERSGNVRVERDTTIHKISKDKYKIEVQEKVYKSNKLVDLDKKTIYKRIEK